MFDLFVQKKSDPSELPLNIELSAQIKLLQNRYACNKPACLTSGYCYVLPDSNTHFTLTHQHLSVWGAALAAKPPIVTLERPPNHKEFDELSAHLLSDTSPLIQHRLAECNNLNKQSAPPAPNTSSATFHFNLPNDVLNFLQPTVPHPPVEQAHVMNSTDTPLLPVSTHPGPDLSLADFCAMFELSPEIQAKLFDNGYTGT